MIMRARVVLCLLLASALAAAGSCGGSEQAAGEAFGEAPRRDGPARVSTSGREAEVQRVVDRLMAGARALEPHVSAELARVAAEVGGRLAGFEHRLKTRASLLRKLRDDLHEHPGLAPSDVVVDDALRYTLEVDDVPAGRHAEAVRIALARLEDAGHRVLDVKNYWPRGDNYSGVNSVLVAPGGFQWELQFHTAESFRVKMRDHHLYEELRETATPQERKRQLYFELSGPWASVPIPAHMLDPKALHPSERIILRQPP